VRGTDVYVLYVAGLGRFYTLATESNCVTGPVWIPCSHSPVPFKDLARRPYPWAIAPAPHSPRLAATFRGLSQRLILCRNGPAIVLPCISSSPDLRISRVGFLYSADKIVDKQGYSGSSKGTSIKNVTVISNISSLSPMSRTGSDGRPLSPSWCVRFLGLNSRRIVSGFKALNGSLLLPGFLARSYSLQSSCHR